MPETCCQASRCEEEILEQAIDFFGAGTEESEDFYISQKIPGDPSKGIPSLEIQQVADRITINELTPDGFFQIYASHQEHPQKGWMPDPETNLNLNNLGRILSILGGKVNLATGADMPLIEEVATYKATKVSPHPNTFWITHECSYLKSKMTCVRHPTRTHTQAKLDAYYIINEGYDHYEINDVEPLPESVCHLLVKFFGYKICEYDDSAIEIDLLYIWQGPRDPDIKKGKKIWYLWLNLSRFRWGFYPELMAIMDGSLNVDSLPQYPWGSQHESVTGWDCGDYVIEVPFCSFNSEAEAEEFGHSCYALAPYEEYCNLLKLLYIDPYGDEERTPVRKDDTKVFLSSSVFDIRSGDLRDRNEWELVSLDEWDTPNLVIGAQLYCQGRETMEGVEA